MTSKIKVDNINKVSDDSNIINKCGTAINVGASGNTVTVTGNDIRSDNYKAADGGVIISQSGTTVTIGASGDTINLASGASQSGFGRTGTVDWQTGSIKTSDFTAANGEGYFVNTTSGAVIVTLPGSPSAGNIVAIADYAGTAASNNITINRNSSPFESGTSNGILTTNRQTATFVYVDGTQGWLAVNSNDQGFIAPAYVAASGGNSTATVGNYKIHTFTGPGTFTVTCSGNSGGNEDIDYLVVAGGGGGIGGGGGAGGFRESRNPSAAPVWAASPLASTTSLNLPATGYPITVGAGANTTGSNSVFSTITSAGGGGGGARYLQGANGGSGGGTGQDDGLPGGTGNTPPVSPPQGNPGGAAPPGGYGGASGGGGATAAGSNGGGPGNPAPGGNGGAGATTTISNSPTAYAGGGGGGSNNGGSGTGGSAGSGGGGAGGGPNASEGACATANTGGGGGGAEFDSATPGGARTGGSGIVIIRYKFQN